MKKIAFALIIIFTIFACKENSKSEVLPKVRSNQEKMPLKEIIKNFQDNLVNGDTIVLNFNLTMEHYIRMDKLSLIKKNNDIHIEPSIEAKTSDLVKEFSTYKIDNKKYSKLSTDTLSLENLLAKNVYRTDKKNAQISTLMLIKGVETLTYYTYNLSDKAKFIKLYFNTMKELFPNEQIFDSNDETFPDLSVITPD